MEVSLATIAIAYELAYARPFPDDMAYKHAADQLITDGYRHILVNVENSPEVRRVYVARPEGQTRTQNMMACLAKYAELFGSVNKPRVAVARAG